MSEHLDRVIDLKKRGHTFDKTANQELTADEFASLERISVYLELIDHADSRAQSLAGMAGTALGVFFAAFIAAFVSEGGSASTVLKVADLVSEILFVVGAFSLLHCIFQSLRPMQIQDPWNEEGLKVHWQEVDRVHESAAHSFWIGTVLLALSIGTLIAADVLLDIGFFAPSTGA